MAKISQEELNKIRKTIIRRLYSKKAFSKGHLLFDRLRTGMPTDLRGYVKDVLKDLMKEGIVLFYGKTKYGEAYQLNIKKLKEIEEIVFSND